LRYFFTFFFVPQKEKKTKKRQNCLPEKGKKKVAKLAINQNEYDKSKSVVSVISLILIVSEKTARKVGFLAIFLGYFLFFENFLRIF
jgi:hypothetical protein